ncbi:MAG: ABC transporter ATP-binding protein, partial [Planctomycetaceae bacterium]
MSEHIFEFVAVTKSYGQVRAVHDLSLRLSAGRHTAILGPSGCGKSTLLRLLTGLEAPTSGTILLDGRIVSQTANVLVAPRQRGAAMVFQDLALWPNLTVRQNVALGLSGSHLSRQDSTRRINEAIELCGIAELANRRPGQLSGGQQQRAALARAMAVRPAFLLLDEPFSGIDLAIKAKLLDEIRALTASLQV